ncbi:hypothetical protein APR04_003479 [Promicromonospora umidemergens]|uniref:Uncharacterized protein n=1 Tax=Promicromonospora umidemergens TaxID=629679 RepID=A0ABP8Y2Y0_9MICO|nr:hypothetical protein [Promicromonospora umidemergens]MCP2284556.1 hypothetical protein [Promicromonospora umidemergens]
MAAGRILRLDAEQWASIQEPALEGGGTAVGTALADHQKAPVCATPVATAGHRGSIAHLTPLDVRRRDGVATPVERPARSVAAELSWALVSAIDAVGEVPADLSSES